MFGWPKKKPSSPNGPDFSAIDSQEKAEQLFRQGEVEKLFLLPLEFGGQDVPDNYLFVPLGVADIKAGIDNNIVRPLIEDNTVTQYSAKAEYQGESFIPAAIRIEAFNPGNFTTQISIWGEALAKS